MESIACEGEPALVQPFDRSRWLSVYPPSVVDDEVRTRNYAHDTQLATQMLRESDDPNDSRADIGRAVGGGVRELFVTTDPAEALQQQFSHLAQEFIAVHDIAINTSRKLLGGVAAAAGRPVQRLLIRRQGYGTTLASIEFVDCPVESGRPVRLYSTDADTDSATRLALARVLMANSTLGVVMVGDLPAHAMADQLAPMRQFILTPGWFCHHLQFMPLFNLPTLADQVQQLAGGSGVESAVTAQVKRPADAWDYLRAAWNLIQSDRYPDNGGTRLAHITANAAAAPAASPVRPQAVPGGMVNIGMPRAQAANPAAAAAVQGPIISAAAPAAAAAPPSPATLLQEGLTRLGLMAAGLPGVVGVCVFEASTSRLLAQAGSAATPEMARRGTTLLAASDAGRRMLQLQGSADEVIVMGPGTSLAVRRLMSRPELAVLVMFTPMQADWPALRPQLMALDATLR